MSQLKGHLSNILKTDESCTEHKNVPPKINPNSLSIKYQEKVYFMFNIIIYFSWLERAVFQVWKILCLLCLWGYKYYELRCVCEGRKYYVRNGWRVLLSFIKIMLLFTLENYSGIHDRFNLILTTLCFSQEMNDWHDAVHFEAELWNS